MAWTNQDIVTLEAAIASGTRKIRFADGREITYHSLQEMLQLLDRLKGEVGARQPPRVSLAKFTRA